MYIHIYIPLFLSLSLYIYYIWPWVQIPFWPTFYSYFKEFDSAVVNTICINMYIYWKYWYSLAQKIIHEDLIQFKIFMNFDNFSCLIFGAQNVLIPPSANIPQEAKCYNTPKLYTTLKGSEILTREK